MKFLAVLAVLGLLLAPIYAADNSRWCGLMVSLYGVCSPELIDNYLLMTQNPPKRPNTIKATVLNSTATLVQGAATVHPLSNAAVGVSITPAPAFRITHYWAGDHWATGRLFN